MAAMLALCLAPLMASADFAMTNPVTGDTENYTWKFVGTDTWNGSQYWQNSDGDNPSGGGVPAKTSGGNIWDPILFDNNDPGNTINIHASMSVEGWNLRMGLYNGANITLNNLQKLQSDEATWFTVDETSQLIIATMASDKLEGSDPLSLYSAREGGITWTPAISNSAIGTGTQKPIHYYLAGKGTVAYSGGISLSSDQVIKCADVTLSETADSRMLRYKTLVSFASSSTSTFTADATIKVKNSDGSALKEVNLDSVTATTPTLTASGNVGDCELVQTTTGVVLYYVDYATDYTPSININFTQGTGLSTTDDVGIGDYAIPGTSWNNLIGNNGSLEAVNGVDETGTASVIYGARLTISGTRGYWGNNGVPAASDLRNGYIDDDASNNSPQFVVEGIPYERYKTILYFASDGNGTKFGYVTVNGVNYKGDLDNTATVVSEGGSDIWGSASLLAYTEGGNYLVIPEQSNTDGTLTVISHRLTGSRAGLAAVQIVEVAQEIGENDLEIPVSGDTTYTVSEDKELTGTVYLTGSGTLTLDGTAKITAAKIHVARSVTLNVNADRLDATTFTGLGTVVYTNALPETNKGWTDSDNWNGTVWINGKSSVTDFNVNSYGNANSAVKLSGVDGWISAPFDNTVPVILENGTFGYALKLTNGNSPNNQYPTRCTTFVKVSGSGTISDGNAANPMLKIYDGTEFTGTITLTRARVVFCLPDSTTLPEAYTSIPAASIYVDVDNSATVSSGKTWTANGGFIVDGTLTVDGALASSHTTKAVSGSGMVVFNGKLPSPTSDAWWKNSDWDGTVQIASVTDLVGGTSWTGYNFLPNDYGNSESVLELKNCSGWLPNNSNYQCTVPLKVTGTLTINNGISGNKFVISKLLGEGAIYTTSNGATTTIQVLSADDFTGYVNLNSKRVIFGENIPSTFTSGQIYVGNGFSFTVPNSDAAWYGAGGIILDGELKAAALSNFGGGTTITTSDNGVFTLTGSDNVNDTTTDYARITGSGTLRYAEVSGKWRTLSKTNFPTNMICENNLVTGLILQNPSETYTIGSLAGSGTIRSDMSNGNRHLRILQAKDTTWSGVFHSDDRIGTVTVAPGITSSGTLTITENQTVSNDLAIESGAAVNLTGKWKGATTVNGTIGGTGTIDGSLTFSDGATFMATNTPLTVSGDIKVPATGVVTVDVSQVTFDAATITILQNSNGIENIGSFKLVGDVPEEYALKEQYGALVLTNSSGGDIPEPAGDQVRFWVENVANADVNVYTNGVLLGSVGEDSGCNIYFPNGDAEVTIVYSAKEGYVIVGQTRYSVPQVSEDLAFPLDPEDIAGMSVTNVNDLTEVAFVTDSKGVNTLYETLNGAFDYVRSNETVTLIRDAELTNNVALTFPVVVAGYGCKMGGPLTLASGSSLTMKVGVAITNVIAVTHYNVTVTYPTDLAEAPTVTPPEGYDEVKTENEDGTSTISFKVHEEPEPPTPSSGYDTWKETNSIEGNWDVETDGIANVFRYVFNQPSGPFQLITNITFNADSHAVIWTPQMVNDTDTESAEFDIFVVPSDDLVFDENDEIGKVSLSSNGETEIDEALHEARFFRLKAEKKSQE